MPKYRVKADRSFGSFSEYGPGDIVELTSIQAASFLDKLELADRTVEVVQSDPKAHLETMTLGQLMNLPEWKNVPDPKPTEKPAVVAAILRLRSGKSFKGEVKKGALVVDEDTLADMTVAEIKNLPEWKNVPDPKPTKKDDIIAAILEVRG